MLVSLIVASITAMAPFSTEQDRANSVQAGDMKGYEQSLYQGKWYDPSDEWNRKCIMKRESHYNYRAANPTSSARGAYQFLDNNWRDGLVWMMLAESKETKDGLRKDIKALRDKPIHRWNRYYQDRAFWTAWRFGEGKNHWYWPGSSCLG